MDTRTRWRYRSKRASLVAALTWALATGVVAAPVATAQPGDAEPAPLILGGTLGDLPVRGLLDPVAETSFPQHPGAIVFEPLRIGADANDAAAIAAIDGCSDGAGIDIVGRGLPSSFDLTVTDPTSQHHATFRQSEAPFGWGFVVPDALPCAQAVGAADGGPVPKQLRSVATQGLVAGSSRTCRDDFSFDLRLRGQAQKWAAQRSFGRGAGGDRLLVAGTDPETSSAVFYARQPSYSSMLFMQLVDDGLIGYLAEGQRGRFGPEDALDFLTAGTDPAALAAFGESHIVGPGTCMWASRISTREKPAAVDRYWQQMVPPAAPVFAPPGDHLDLPLPLGEGRFTAAFELDGSPTVQPLDAVVPGDDGAFWFFDAGDTDVVVRVLDGCPVNGHYWVFFGGQTDIPTGLSVTDTTTGTMVTYPGDDLDGATGFLDLEPLFDCSTVPGNDG